jgi:hypothetical protein
MNLRDIQRAETFRKMRATAIERKRSLSGMVVVSLHVGNHADDARPIELKKGGPGGTGTVSSIGLPDELRDALQDALIKWADDTIMLAEEELKLLGVDLTE